MRTEQIAATAGLQLGLDEALALASLDCELKLAERAYDKAMRNPRGEGLAETGARLQNLYARARARGDTSNG
jgi:hypothetical protein